MASITKSDIQEIRAINDSIGSFEKIEPYINEAEEIDIREFLGEALYYDYKKNISSTKYVNLLRGTTWIYSGNTIKFDGLKVAIAYLGYARFIQMHPISVTKAGIVKKSTEFSEPVSDQAIAVMVTQARSTANNYLGKAKHFLDNNTSTYTLWGYGGGRTPAASAGIRCLTSYKKDSDSISECNED